MADSADRPIMPVLRTLPIVQQKFIKNYVKHNGNATLAYRNTQPVTYGAAATQAGRLLKRLDVRQAIMEEMERAGVTLPVVSQRIFQQLAHTDADIVNKGIVHSRAILGLDAARELHQQIDKREIKVTVSATDFSNLLAEAKKRDK